MIRQNKIFSDEIKSLLKKMIGCECKKIVHDEFTYTNSVYGQASLFINNKVFNINNEIEIVEYYGAKEDIAFLGFKEVSKDKVKSLLQNKKQIEIPIRKAIKSIDIVNYHIYVKVDGKEYDNTWTEGVIFKFEDNQIAFERSDSFTEMIEIYKGYDLISKFTPVEEFGEPFNNPTILKTDSDIITIN